MRPYRVATSPQTPLRETVRADSRCCRNLAGLGPPVLPDNRSYPFLRNLRPGDERCIFATYVSCMPQLLNYLLRIVFPAWALAASIAMADWSALEEQLDADCRDGELQQHALVEAACIVSGVTSEAELQSLLTAWEQACAAFAEQDSCGSLADPAAKAGRLLQYLHGRVLTGRYQADCTHVTEALQGNAFNCVSATVLFQELSRRYGLPVRPIATPTHVLSSLPAPAGFVETTRADGVRRSPAVGDDVRRYTPDARPLSDVQLLAKIYYNRGVQALQRQDFVAAMQYLQRSCAWDPLDPQARCNWLAAVNNGALAELQSEQWATAAELVRTGLAVDPGHASLRANDVHIHQQWALALCAQGNCEQAAELLAARSAARPDEPLFHAVQQFILAKSRNTR